MFVRNPDRVPAAQRERGVAIHKGDLNDHAALRDWVKATPADAIIEASSALALTRPPPGQPANNADRRGILLAVAEGLAAADRLASTRLLVVGGQLVPEPGGVVTGGVVAHLIAFALRITGASRALSEGVALLYGPNMPPFVMCRMGFMEEGPSRGTLRAERSSAPGARQHGTVAYVDVGRALVELAGAPAAAWPDRSAIYLNYEGGPKAGA